MEAQLLGFKNMAISAFLWFALNLIAVSSYSQCSVSISSSDSALVCGETSRLSVNADWQLVNTIPFNWLRSLSFPSNQIGFLGGDSGSVYKTINGGTSFTKLNSPKPNSKTNSLWFFNEQNGLAFTDSSEIFKTNNSGNSWNKINYLYSFDSAYNWNMRTFKSVYFTSSNIGYVGGGIYAGSGHSQAILHKTIDGGNTWIQLPVSDYKPIDKVYFLDSLTGFLCTNGNLLKTINGGNSWTAVISYPSLYFNDINFINKDTGFLASNGLMRTYDGGNTWTALNTNFQFSQTISSDKNGFVYIIIGAAIFRSSDFGNTWQGLKINANLPSIDNQIVGLSFKHQHPGIAIGTNHWTRAGFVIKTDLIDSVFWSPSFGLDDSLTINPLAKPSVSTTYLATIKVGNCITYSDYTILVEPIVLQLPAQQIVTCDEALQFTPTSNMNAPNALTYAWSPSIYLSNPSIQNPIATIKSNTKYTLRASSNNGCFDTATTTIKLNFTVNTSPDIFLKCGNQGTIGILEDGWSKQSIELVPTPLNELKDIAFPNGDTAYLIGDKYIWKSFDKGKTWILNYSATTPGHRPQKAYFRNTKLGFVAAFNDGPMLGSILKTTNGNDWQVSTISGMTGYYAIPSLFFPTDQIGFAIANPNKILKSTNGGNNWTPSSSGTTNSLSDICFPSATVGYVCGASGTVVKTIDGGTNWIKLNTGISNQLNRLFFISNDTGFVGGNGDTIWRTHNGGISWNPFKINYHFRSNYEIKDIYFVNSTNGYLATSFTTTIPMFYGGAIFETTNGGLSWQRIMSADSTTPLVALFANSSGFGNAIGGTNTFLIKNSSPNSLLWSPSIGLLQTEGKQVFAKPLQTTTYTVTASINDCFAKDSILVSVSKFMQPATQNHEIVCGDSFNFINPNVHLYIDGSRQGLSNWEILNQQNNVVMKSTYDKVEFGNYYLSPGNYTFKWRPTGPAMHQIIKIIPIVGDSISEEFFYTLDTLKVRNFTVGSTQNFSYNWFPKQALVGPNTPITNYTLSITSPEGCQGNDSLTITPKPFRVKLNGYTYGAVYGPLGCGSEVQLDSTLSNYTGKGKLSFKWAEPKLVDDTNSFLPKLSPVKSGFISMQAYTPNGCQASDSVQFIVEPLFVRIMDTSVSCKTSFKPSIFTNYNGSKPLIGSWTPTIDLDSANNLRPTITPTSNRTYVVNFSSNIGCAATDTFKLNLMQGKGPSICLVGVDEQNKNRIIWNKTEALNTDRFFLYKESNVTNQYNQFAEIMPTQDFIYIDSNSSPLVQSSKYLLQRLDVCGITSNFGTPHKTMHLTINKGSGNTWNLIWNTYEGFTVSTYNIYRGTNASDLKQIGTSAGSNNAYTDLTAPAGDVYYQVELISPNNCSPNKTYNTSKSNIMSNKFLSMAEPTLGLNFSMYPNPTKNQLSIVMENMNEPCTATLFSMDGKTLLSQILDASSSELYLGQFAAGVYLIEIKNSKGKAHQFVVKE